MSNRSQILEMFCTSHFLRARKHGFIARFGRHVHLWASAIESQHRGVVLARAPTGYRRDATSTSWGTGAFLDPRQPAARGRASWVLVMRPARSSLSSNDAGVQRFALGRVTTSNVANPLGTRAQGAPTRDGRQLGWAVGRTFDSGRRDALQRPPDSSGAERL